ncbi:MAG TPA: serine hydrolase [Pseudonocardia sp.]|uniref:serine hydrolase n=1 Tax=Pseudonocardia sp. TaxID=60912 RepID=UPI002C364927|nr:serine hydrolase [Pseudonocardia sp.]HTF52960.1 serine hydrolase [Pseudonocardia sp.]
MPVATMVPESEPGTVCRYNSGETQALAALVARATGRSVSAYMQDKLCEPLGMVSPGYWMVDPAGTEQGYVGLNLTARDYAKLGELYRNSGVWQGSRSSRRPGCATR